MRRICLAGLALALSGLTVVAAQDATEARLSELSGRISALEEAQGTFRKQLADISQQLDRLRESMNKPQANYATAEDLKSIAEKLKEVDAKRVEDFNGIKTQFASLASSVKELVKQPPKAADKPPQARQEEKGYEHTVAAGETLSAIIQAYRDQKVNVTLQDVLKANPGLKPERMRVGQVIWIPDPTRK